MTIAANLVHTFAMAVWLGALVLILVALRPAQRAADLANFLPLFSRVALTAVAALLATGVVMAWREVGSINALTATTFGRVLMLKLFGVALMVPIANLARRWVKRRLPDGAGRTTAQARQSKAQPEALGHSGVPLRGLTAELGITFGVLAVTAALVVIAPPQ